MRNRILANYNFKRNRKAAMEMSVGTIVTIVLLMTVLIMGIFLIRQIFISSKYNIDQLDQKVRGEIDKLFTEEQPLVLYLANNLAEVKQGDSYGVAFGFKNLETGTSQEGIFTYETVFSNPGEVKDDCGIETIAVEKWMTGEEETTGIPVRPGAVGYGLVRFDVPKTAPLCTIRFRINVEKDGGPHGTGFFDLKISS